jgi:hypothetical protein
LLWAEDLRQEITGIIKVIKALKKTCGDKGGKKLPLTSGGIRFSGSYSG